MTDIYDLSWRVRLFESEAAIDAAITESAQLTSENAEYDALYLDHSVRLFNDRSIAIPSVFVGGRVFLPGELVTMYSGRLMKTATKIAQNSDHVIQAYGQPGKVIIGINSRQRARLPGAGAASLINDGSIDVNESLRQSRLANRAVIVRRSGVRGTANVEFVALVLEREYMAMRHGYTDTMPSTRIGIVALTHLGEGSELSIEYGDTYWTTFLEHHLAVGTTSLAEAMGDTISVQRTNASRLLRLRVAAGF